MEKQEKDKHLSSVKGFGAKLKAEREARDVPLEEISRISKVSMPMLLAMEEDRWEDTPGGIFTRNFIRLYARHLGLEAEKLVDEYSNFIEIKSKAETPSRHEGIDDLKHEDASSYTWMYMALAATIVLLTGGFIMINMLGGGGAQQGPAGNSEAIINTENQNGEKPLEQASGGQSRNQQPAILSEEEQTGLRVSLVETSRSTTWFQWQADGELQSPPDGENLLLNEQRTFSAEKTIWFNITRIQSITLHVNGEKRDWADFNPVARRNEDGSTISYIVEIRASDLE